MASNILTPSRRCGGSILATTNCKSESKDYSSRPHPVTMAFVYGESFTEQVSRIVFFHAVSLLGPYLLLNTHDKVRKVLAFPATFFIVCFLTTSNGDDGHDEVDFKLKPKPSLCGESVLAVKGYFGPTTRVQVLPDIGSRLQKTWTKVDLFVAVPIAPKDYKFDVDAMKMINDVLRSLMHPHVLPVLAIEHLMGENNRFLLSMQWGQACSLRDLIYGQCDPSLDWSEKYSPEKGYPLSKKDVSSCGRQILEGMIYLYDQGFPCIGHVQSGNVFVGDIDEMVKVILDEEPVDYEEKVKDTFDVGMAVDCDIVEGGKEEEVVVDDVVESCGQENRSKKIFCRVGGYENMLLGYKTRLYGTMASRDLLDRIDVVMFGQIVYEMACGRELPGPLPEAGDYEAIYDDEVKAVMRRIFELGVVNNDHRSALAEIMAMDLFKSAELPTPQFPTVELPKKLKENLNKFLTTRKPSTLEVLPNKGKVITKKLKNLVDHFYK